MGYLLKYKKCHLALNLTLGLLLSCSKATPPEIPENYEDLSDLTVYSSDVRAVTNIELVPDQTFASSDEVIFGRLGAIETDRDGKVYITDMDQKTIHVFDVYGDYLTSIGREGFGPGEFNYIHSVRAVSDSLFVLDIARQMESVFSTKSFDLLGSMNLRPVNLNQIEELQGSNPSQLKIRSDGTYLVGFLPPRQIESLGDSRTISFYKMDRERMVNPNSVIEVNDLEFLITSMNGEPRAATFDFTPKGIISLSNDDEIFVTAGDKFVIKTYDQDGKYTGAFYHSSYTGVPLNRNELLREYPNEMHQKMIREANLPKKWPAFDTMLNDDEGQLWVSAVVDDFNTYEWWVLDENTGELITRFTWPRNEPIEVVRGGFVYTRQTVEETGLQKVIRYRIYLEEV